MGAKVKLDPIMEALELPDDSISSYLDARRAKFARSLERRCTLRKIR